MAGLPGGIVVLIAIVAAAAVVAIAAAMHKVYSERGRMSDVETTDAMIGNIGNEQSHYMRDVRMRGQLQSWGVAPAYEGSYDPPRSQVGGMRSASRGGDTMSNFG